MLRTLSVSFLVLVLASSSARAHGTLVSSTPANKSVVAQSPKQVQLVFSEPIEVGMSSLALVGAQGTTPLHVTLDPRNVNALLADLDPLAAGSYAIRWKILSADGHAVSGIINFAVGTSSGVRPAAEAETTDVSSSHDNMIRLAMLLRGIGITAMMALAGLLLFALRAEPHIARDYSRLASALAITGSVALIFHFVLWCVQATAGLGNMDIAGVIQTSAGRREAIRTAFAFLVVWAWWLARARRLTLLLAGGTIMCSAFIGHAAATVPLISIPLKVAHLLAASVWLGGLAWILLLESDGPRFHPELRKVSSAAGWCALIVFLSGMYQGGIVLSWDPAALTSRYALVAALKLTGFVILVGLGAVNRFRVLPAIDAALASGKLKTIVGREISIMVVVALLGGVLSYLSAPVARSHASSTEIRQ